MQALVSMSVPPPPSLSRSEGDEHILKPDAIGRPRQLQRERDRSLHDASDRDKVVEVEEVHGWRDEDTERRVDSSGGGMNAPPLTRKELLAYGMTTFSSSALHSLFVTYYLHLFLEM